MRSNKLIVYDLDETLVHATEEKLGHEPDFCLFDYFVYERPFVHDLLDFSFENFKVGVWTSASSDYANRVVRNVFPNEHIEFVFARERCTRKFDSFEYTITYAKRLKKLKKLGFRLESIIMVDDSPEKYLGNYGNLVRLSPFLGNKSDSELQYLIRYLAYLKEKENIRSIEKRWWQSELRSQQSDEPNVRP